MNFVGFHEIEAGIEFEHDVCLNLLKLQAKIFHHMPDHLMCMNRLKVQLKFLTVNQRGLQYSFHLFIHPLVFFLDDTTEIF